MTATSAHPSDHSHSIRRGRKTVSAAAALGIGASLVALPAAVADPDAPVGESTQYTLELQARANLLVNDDGFNLPPNSSFNSITPDLNDLGEVAFRVQYAAHDDNPFEGDPGIWVGGAGEGEIVHRATGESISNDVWINDDTAVAFTEAVGFNSTLWWLDPSQDHAAEAVSTTPVLPNSYASPMITNESVFAFQATFSGGRALATADGDGGRFVLTDSGVDPASPYGFVYTPSYNEANQFAVKVGYPSDLAADVEIVLADGHSEPVVLASSTTIDPESPYSGFDNSLAVNDHGDVAVVATRAADNARVVVRLDEDGSTEIAAVGDDGLTEIQYFSPDINNHGDVVFRGSDATGQAVFVGDGGALTRVAGQGDEAETDLGVAQLGQHDASPVFGGAPRINNLGQISFTAGVHPAGDNQVEWGTGVFVADPPVVEGPSGPSEVVRVAGSNRYATSAVLALEEFDPGVPAVYLATGTGFADALAASSAAGAAGGPVLLTRTSTVPDEVVAAIAALDPAEIVIVGGSGVVDDDVIDQLEDAFDAEVRRLTGRNRYGTAAAVAAEAENPEHVYVTTGLDYPDALAASARAAADGSPLLLVNTRGVPNATREALTDLVPERITVVGGHAVVPEMVIEELSAYAPVTSLSGHNRFATAAAVAETYEDVDSVYVATGRAWPDALSAAAVAGHRQVPIVLVEPIIVPNVTEEAIVSLEPETIRVVGGSVPIVDEVLEALSAIEYGP